MAKRTSAAANGKPEGLTRDDVRAEAERRINLLLAKAGLADRNEWTRRTSLSVRDRRDRHENRKDAKDCYIALTEALKAAKVVADEVRFVDDYALRLRHFFDEMGMFSRVWVKVHTSAETMVVHHTRDPHDELETPRSRLVARSAVLLWPGAKGTAGELALFSLAILDVARIDPGDRFDDVLERETDVMKKEKKRVSARLAPAARGQRSQ